MSVIRAHDVKFPNSQYKYDGKKKKLRSRIEPCGQPPPTWKQTPPCQCSGETIVPHYFAQPEEAQVQLVSQKWGLCCFKALYLP